MLSSLGKGFFMIACALCAHLIAQAMKPFFEDNTIEDLIIVAQKYREIDAWCSEPVLSEDSLNNLMTVMEEANQLEKRPPYSELVTTEFAENAINNSK